MYFYKDGLSAPIVTNQHSTYGPHPPILIHQIRFFSFKKKILYVQYSNNMNYQENPVLLFLIDLKNELYHSPEI